MATILHKAATRGHANHGWLDTYHTFSFAGYHDPSRVHFGALRVLNDDIVKGGYGFGKHPHDNMEIISVVLDGVLEHKDSMGHTQAIHSNEVQVMSAGTGIVHSEYNHSREQDVNLLQIWIFPDMHNVAPRYDQKVFSAEERLNKLQQLVSPMGTTEDGLKIHQDARIYRTTLQSGQSLKHTIRSAQHGLYVFIIEGSANVAGILLEKRDGLGIADTADVNILASTDSDILLLEVPMTI